MATNSGRHRPSTCGGRWGTRRRAALQGGTRGETVKNRREQGQLGSRRTNDATRRATSGNTYASTVTCLQEAHEVETRGQARGWALRLLWRSACCRVLSAAFGTSKGKEVCGNCGFTEYGLRLSRVGGACENAPRRAGGGGGTHVVALHAINHSVTGLCGVGGAAAVVSARAAEA